MIKVMKEILALLIVGVFVLSGIGAVALTVEESELKEVSVVTFSQPVLKSGNEYLTINVKETNSFIMKQGKPMLPSYVKTFTFPFGTEIKSVSGTPKNIQTMTITKDIEPTPQAVVAGQAISSKQTINYVEESYPENWFQYDVGCGLIDGELSIIVETEFSPIKYYPAKNIIDWANEVEISIEYEKIFVKQPSATHYELLIIAPDEFSNELAPLVKHKIVEGITTKFAGLSEVYSRNGRDNQEKIKYYIRDAIENWGTTNVLLVGAWHDTEPAYQKLPARETHIESTETPDDEIIVSDLYYADIYDGNMNFCSWDADGDDVFGEWLDNDNIDGVDLHPDVYLGRIPSRTGNEVTTIVNKIKNYENNNSYMKDWFTKLVVLGGDTSPGFEVLEGEYVNQNVIDMMGGFSYQKLWVSNEKLTSWEPTGIDNIKNAISEGCGFISFSGHGTKNTWATHPENDEFKWVPTPANAVTDANIRQTKNGDKLPIIVIEACSTAKFNKDNETFSYAFLQNSNGGGIGTFGATGLAWGYVGTGITTGLIGKMGLDTFRAYIYSDATTLGEMWGGALERFTKTSMDALDAKTTEEWQMFGDPTLKIGAESNSPLKPSKPSGPVSGKIGEIYTYLTFTTDPDGDQVFYKWDWGDGTFSDWIGPVDGGSNSSASKTWTECGEYIIRVAAKDTHGKTSSWSDSVTLSIPRSNNVNLHSYSSSQSIFIQTLQKILGQSIMFNMGVDIQ